MRLPYIKQPVRHNKVHTFFYFNVADESHAKLLERTRRVDPMKLLGKELQIDEY
jgi:hypothetical protein